ncbi:hypothetical protein BDM02DRAFT_3192226 [Thelephora ganbajun]|uniref:Uncharacterized protein n=1 Tax=Thelephora ganbajun TaxID=370292 RepID=A0ACB6Z0C8_THEGA|nr:hypothetical protein BDM02DRAFT_3192226 [Thelephora ganbajun]
MPTPKRGSKQGGGSQWGHGGAQKSKAPLKKKPAGTRAKDQQQLPRLPEGAHTLSHVNQLHHLLARRDFSRPWLVFDSVDPAPKFRRMGLEFNWSNPPADIPEGNDPDAIMDKHVEGETLPVVVPGYSQMYLVELVDNEDDDGKMEEESLFSYDYQSLCTIKVYNIIQKLNLMEEQKQIIALTCGELTAPKTYEIHRGYCRVLTGFLREIKLMTDGLQKDHNCLFHGTYLMIVLDFFVLDLRGITEGVEAEWRSAALNPLLQRQLRGLQDQETGMIKMDVGRTLDEVEEFYLKKDPLDPDNIKELLRSLVYIWPVQWSLGHLRKETNHRESYYEVYCNTRYALEVFTDTENYNANPVLHDYELQIVKNEGIEQFYRHCRLIKDNETGGGAPPSETGEGPPEPPSQVPPEPSSQTPLEQPSQILPELPSQMLPEPPSQTPLPLQILLPPPSLTPPPPSTQPPPSSQPTGGDLSSQEA